MADPIFRVGLFLFHFILLYTVRMDTGKKTAFIDDERAQKVTELSPTYYFEKANIRIEDMLDKVQEPLTPNK